MKLVTVTAVVIVAPVPVLTVTSAEVGVSKIGYWYVTPIDFWNALDFGKTNWTAPLATMATSSKILKLMVVPVAPEN